MTRRYRSKAKLRTYARRISLAALFLSVVFLFTWPYLRTAFLKFTVPIGRGTVGALEERVSGEAVFAGGFSTVVAPAPGTLQLFVSSGESVRTGQVIAEVGNQGNSKAFKDSLAFSKGQLIEYEAKTEGEFSALSSSIQGIYDKAVALFFKAQTAKAAGAIGAASEYEALLEREEDVLKGHRSRLSEIEAERARLTKAVAGIEAAQASSSVKILSPASGVFSSEVTAVDAKFTDGYVSGRSASELASLAREGREARLGTVRDGQKVQAGDVVGRVVSGQGISFYLPVKTEDKPEVKERSRVDVTVGGGQAMSAEITRVIDGAPPGYSIIVGAIAVMPADDVVKAAEVSVIVKRRSGVIVPRSSIMEKGGRQGVLTIQKTYARFQEVQVLMVKGDRAAVKGISETDEIVLKARSFLEGRRVR